MRLVVSGPSGLIGSEVIKLANSSHEVVRVVKSTRQKPEIASNEIRLPAQSTEEVASTAGAKHSEMFPASPQEKTVFVHCAWTGRSSEARQNMALQLQNISMTANMLRLATQMNADKFVYLASMEQVRLERHNSMRRNHEGKNAFHNLYYAQSKKSAEDVAKVLAYKAGIEFLAPKISMVYDSKLRDKNYLTRQIKSIIQANSIEPPQSKELYDASSSSLLAEQILHLCLSETAKGEIVLGRGRPSTLHKILSQYASLLGKNLEFSNLSSKLSPPPMDEQLLEPSDFNPVMAFDLRHDVAESRLRDFADVSA